MANTVKQSKKQSSKEKQIAGLKPFKKGETGNPKGRPKKGTAIADILNKLLDTPREDKTRREIIIEKVLTLAENGEQWAVHFIADRTEGKAVERVVTREDKDELIIIG